MNYDLICYGKFKEKLTKCQDCPDKIFCQIKAEIKEKECETDGR